MIINDNHFTVSCSWEYYGIDGTLYLIATADVKIIDLLAAVPGQCDKPTITNICLESMTVNWDEPKYDGGSPVTGYIVEKKETTAKRWTRVTRDPIRALPLGNNWDVTSLLENSLYQFRVIAVNAAGCGLPSMPSDPILCRDPISKTDFLSVLQSVV